MAQNIEKSVTNEDGEINASCEIIWPINKNQELDNMEILLNNPRVRNNQVKLN